MLNRIDNNPSPLVSIIVPIYNVEQYLPACLDSLVNQTLHDIEIICVNDGSPDDSAVIVRNYMKEDCRIQLVEQENKGLSGARNSGIEVAKGKYVYFMDSDDILEPKAMEMCHKIAEETLVDIISFDALPFWDNGYEGKHIAQYDRSLLLSHVANKTLSSKALFREMLQVGAMRPSVWLSFIRRELLEKYQLRFEEGLIHEDELFTPKLYMLAEKAIYIPHVFFHRRIRGNSIMTSTKKEVSLNALCHIIEELMIFARHRKTQELISWRCEQLLSYANTKQDGYIKARLPMYIYFSIEWRTYVRCWKRKIKKYFT